MKKTRNDLAEFMIGLAMLIVGVVLFMQRVTVSSGFGGGLYLGGFHVPTGALFIPLIVGVIMIFVRPDSLWSKIVLGASILILLFAVIMSVDIHMRSLSMFEWIIYLVLIFGGLGLVGRVVLAKPKEKKSEEKKEDIVKEDNIKSELDALKNGIKSK